MTGKNIRLITIITLIAVFFVPLLSAKQAPVDKQFAYAEGLFEARQYSDAIAEYLKVIALYPDNEFKDKSQFKIGESYSLLSNDGVWLSINEWQKLIDKYPSSSLVEKARENIKLAKIFLQREEIPIITEEDRVSDRCLYFSKDARWSSAYMGGYGMVYNAHFKEMSLLWADRVITDYPATLYAVNALMYKAALYNEQQSKKDYIAEIAEYQKIVDQYPDSVYADRAQSSIGDIYENNLRNRKAALETYQKLIDRRKNDPDNYYVSYAEAQIKFFK